MKTGRGRLIAGLVLLVIIGGLVCYDIYRAQTVARNVIRYAEAGQVTRLSALIKPSAITDRLYRDSEPLAEAMVAPVEPAPQKTVKKGFLSKLWARSKTLVGLGHRPEAPPAEAPPPPPDLHLCTQTLGEAKGFAILIRSLKPAPVGSGLRPDPRIRYGAFNTRQYLMTQTGPEAQYLLVSRTRLLDWQVTGVRLSEGVRKQITRTCLGVI